VAEEKRKQISAFPRMKPTDESVGDSYAGDGNDKNDTIG